MVINVVIVVKYNDCRIVPIKNYTRTSNNSITTFLVFKL